MNNASFKITDFFFYQRQILIFVLVLVSLFIACIYFFYLIALKFYRQRRTKNVKIPEIKIENDNSLNKILEILVILIFTIIALVADSAWLYALYLFIIGPRIASESYLINIIRAWKTTRKEERHETAIENLNVEKKSKIVKDKK